MYSTRFRNRDRLYSVGRLHLQYVAKPRERKFLTDLHRIVRKQKIEMATNYRATRFVFGWRLLLWTKRT